MVRRTFRIGMRMGILAGAAYAVVKTLQSRRTPALNSPAPSPAPSPVRPVTPAPPPRPAPAPQTAEPAPRPNRPLRVERPVPVKKAADKPVAKPPAEKPAARASDDGDGDGPLWVTATAGVCPPSHPIKAKLASRIFHVPGGTNYARTRPDRCYRDAASATADGLRPAAR